MFGNYWLGMAAAALWGAAMTVAIQDFWRNTVLDPLPDDLDDLCPCCGATKGVCGRELREGSAR